MGPPRIGDRTYETIGYAILSRIFLLSIVATGVFFVSPLPYDTSSTLVFRGPNVSSGDETIPQSIEEGWQPTLITKVLSRLASWDALYFSTIAKDGYLWEHYYAFFPGYPTLISLLSGALQQTGISLSPTDLLLLSGFVISNLAFVMCSIVVYNMSRLALRNESLAFRSAMLFVFSPANPFFFSLYTESIFALFSFSGMYFAVYEPQERGRKTFLNLLAAVLFALATSVRSNGVILAGFLLYPAFHRLFWQWKEGNYARAAYEILEAMVCTIICIAPLIAYLYSAYMRFCIDFARPWCTDSLPNIYSFVQNFYWNVGFLNYYRVHQIPNFLLAGPVLALAFATMYTYFKVNWVHIKWLAFYTPLPSDKHIKYGGFYNPQNFVFVVHLFALVLSSLPFIHIQVLTRFLFSQCPPLYWFLAHVLSQNGASFLKKSILTYIAVFNVLGIVLFSNFLPWT
jgi:phosphatidylinositol glycan class V